MYAQCEDDLDGWRWDYIRKTGQARQNKRRTFLQNDHVVKLISDSMRWPIYKKKCWRLKAAAGAFASGIIIISITYPEVKPALLNGFEPWYLYYGPTRKYWPSAPRYQGMVGKKDLPAHPPSRPWCVIWRNSPDQMVLRWGLKTQTVTSVTSTRHVTFYFRPRKCI